MSNTVTKFEPKSENKVSRHRKEKHGLHSAYLAINKKGSVIAELRTYWPDTVCYACIWIHGDKFYANGSDRAGGGGYCKESAACGGAISNAGIDLEHNIHGVGQNAVVDGMEAIGRHIAGKEFLTVIRTHP